MRVRVPLGEPTKEITIGDPSTHIIFYSAYWYLVFEEDGKWVNTDTYDPVCPVGAEQKLLELKEIK